MRIVLMACLLFFTIGMTTGCDQGPKGDPEFQKSKADPDEMKNLIKPDQKLQEAPPM